MKTGISKKSYVLFGVAIGLCTVLGPVLPGGEVIARQQAAAAIVSDQQGGQIVGSEGFAGGFSEATVINLADVTFQPFRSVSDHEIKFKASPAERRALQEKARNMPLQNVFQPWDSDQTMQPEQSAAPTVSSGFDALDVSDCCGGGTSVPPDSDMAAGLSYLIAVENSSFEIYDKSGTVVVSSILFDDLFSSNSACSGLFDPTVLYDSEEDRYLMAVTSGSHFCLAVTAVDDSITSWYLYSFDARFYGDEFFDYPHIGIGDHAIFMGANMFDGSVPSGFEGRLYAMDKNAAYSGSTMSWRTASAGYDSNAPQPLNLTGFPQGTVPQPFDTHYFISDYSDGTTASLWAWPDALDSGVPAVVQTYDLNTATGFTAGFPVDVPQSGSTDMIAANDWRFRSFEYRNGQGWVADTISGDVGSGAVNFERVFTMDLSDPLYPVINATVGGYGDSHVIFPDLAVDHCGNLALGHERSDSTMFPSIEVGGMISGAGMLEFPTPIKAGEATYYSFDGSPLRWGDYSGMAIDPDGKTFWYIGEYAKNIPANPQAANYGNYVARLTYDCAMDHIVIYNGNSNSSGTVPVDGNGYSSGDTVTVLSNSGNLEKTGFTFNDWNTAADGSGTSYSDGTSFTIGNLSVILYAQWSQIFHTLTIVNTTQDWGEITSSPAGITCGSDCLVVYEYNTSVTLTATPTNGSKFISWSGDNDCSDGTVTMISDLTCTAFFYHFPWPMFVPATTGAGQK